jgi:predicted RNA binding protein YcfA (HicA-like mRNA interferase family)
LSKLPRGISGRELIKRLGKAGFLPQRTEGDHQLLRHPDGRAVTIPLDPEIGPGLMSDIMNEPGMTREEFITLVQNPKKWRKMKERQAFNNTRL